MNAVSAARAIAIAGRHTRSASNEEATFQPLLDGAATTFLDAEAAAARRLDGTLPLVFPGMPERPLICESETSCASTFEESSKPLEERIDGFDSRVFRMDQMSIEMVMSFPGVSTAAYLRLLQLQRAASRAASNQNLSGRILIRGNEESPHPLCKRVASSTEESFATYQAPHSVVE